MEAKSLTVEPRTDFGKNASRRARRNGFIPAVIYSHGESESIQIPRKEFFKLFKGKISESVIFDIHSTVKKDDTEKMAYVKDYIADPISGEILHVDLFKVTKGEKIHTHVPIVFTGTAKGVKLGGILEVDLREIEVECLPQALPEKIVIDVTNMEIGDSIHVKDVVVAEGVKLMGNPDASIASVHVPKVVSEEVKVEEAVAVEGEGEAAKKAAEGEETKDKDKEKDKEKK
ncbi:MAG TPA: 50S ribosomal protein L25 [Spirochaetota bacterium]|nr:50S ribosomal protein L25 [Spirochaetota bacterium]HPV41924.1 50S ribosomal protein L25 [Spirochaetota bacterium]